MDVTFRQATLDDLPVIVGLRDDLNVLERQACSFALIQRMTVEQFADKWGHSFADPDHYWLLAESSGQALGYGLIYLIPKTKPLGAFVHWMYLSPLARGQGLGRKMFENLASWARGRGARHIDLQYIEGNTSAAGFWKKMGFAEYARKCVKYLEDTAP